MRGVDYYQVLGVSPSANSTQIKASYKSLAKKFHPDLNGDAKKMAKLNEAYRVLSDPEARQKYNQTLDLPRSTARHHYDNSEGYVYTPHTRQRNTTSTRPRPQASSSRSWTPPERKSKINKWAWAATFAVLIGVLFGAGLHTPTQKDTNSGLTNTTVTNQQTNTPSYTLNDTPPSTNPSYSDPTAQNTSPSSSGTDTTNAQQACSQYRKHTRSYTNCMNNATNCSTNSYYSFGC